MKTLWSGYARPGENEVQFLRNAHYANDGLNHDRADARNDDFRFQQKGAPNYR
ncbi:MAG: hypothetical protein WBM13_04765 [Bacteroidia bacterium]